ncbi:MAG: Type 1 glutamine amidotransferase-like domain-containing protein [Pirellulales bacterium]
MKSDGDRTVTWRQLTEADGTCEIVAAAATAVRSDEPAKCSQDAAVNPLGMPAPRDVGRWGTVVLHGGRYDPRVIATFPTLPGTARPNFVHCPAASSRWRPQPEESAAALRSRLEEDLYEWPTMQRRGVIGKLDFLTTATPADARSSVFVAPLRKAHAVWFSGGDQSVLANLFIDANRPTLFQQELREVLRRGGAVGGTSAGMAAMARVMTVDESAEPGAPPRAHIAQGFGLLDNVILEQHYLGEGRGGRIERFVGLLFDNQKTQELLRESTGRAERLIGLVVEEKTALVVKQNQLRVFGDRQAHVFLKSFDQKTLSWHALMPGDEATIRETDDGPVLKMEHLEVRP